MEPLTARASLNQATIRDASLREAIDVTAAAGFAGIGLWRDKIDDVGLEAACRMLADSGLKLSSVCRGGFLTAADAGAAGQSLDDNRRAIAETAQLAGAAAPGSLPLLVIVAGGLPSGSRALEDARARLRERLAVLSEFAQEHGVLLGIEALHPMFAADRCVVSTLGQALDLAADHDPLVAVVDSYHVWWDPAVHESIARAGRLGKLASYQVSDWVYPVPADNLNGRAMMGDGAIDFGSLTASVTAAGYDGLVEVEIFDRALSSADPADVARRVMAAYRRTVAGEVVT